MIPYALKINKLFNKIYDKVNLPISFPKVKKVNLTIHFSKKYT